MDIDKYGGFGMPIRVPAGKTRGVPNPGDQAGFDLGGLPLPADFWRIHGPAMSEIAVSLARLPSPVDPHFLDTIQRSIDLAADPVRRALLTRVMGAVVPMSAALDSAASARVLANESGRDVLLDLIEQAPAPAEAPPDEGLSGARVRGLRMRQEILNAEGGAWSAKEVGAHLGISRQAVERRRQRGHLLGLPIGGKSYAYPRWQFDADSVIDGFAEVLAALTVPGAWTRAAFFLGANTFLEGARPLDELRQGHLDAVLRAATNFGEQLAA